MARNVTLLAGLTGVLLYATVHWGGVVREDRDVYLLALGAIVLFAGLLRFGTERAPRLSPIFRWLLPLRVTARSPLLPYTLRHPELTNFLLANATNGVIHVVTAVINAQGDQTMTSITHPSLYCLNNCVRYR